MTQSGEKCCMVMNQDLLNSQLSYRFLCFTVVEEGLTNPSGYVYFPSSYYKTTNLIMIFFTPFFASVEKGDAEPCLA